MYTIMKKSKRSIAASLRMSKYSKEQLSTRAKYMAQKKYAKLTKEELSEMGRQRAYKRWRKDLSTDMSLQE